MQQYQETCKFLTENMKALYSRIHDFWKAINFLQYKLFKKSISVFAVKFIIEEILSLSSPEPRTLIRV